MRRSLSKPYLRHRQTPLGYQGIGVDARTHHPGAGVEMYRLTLEAWRQFGRPRRSGHVLSVLALQHHLHLHPLRKADGCAYDMGHRGYCGTVLA